MFMKKVYRLIRSRIMLWLVLALFALCVMGTVAARPAHNDLNGTALQLAGESSGDIRFSARELAFRNPGAVLRANVVRY